MRHIFFPLIIIMLLTFSCNNDDPKSKTDLLTQSGWVATSIKFNPSMKFTFDSLNVIYVADLFDILNDCAKDDVLKFEPSGNYIIDSKVKCEDESEIYELGNWSFNSTTTKLFYGILSSYYDYDIISLTESELILRRNIYDYDENDIIIATYTETYTYKHE